MTNSAERLERLRARAGGHTSIERLTADRILALAEFLRDAYASAPLAVAAANSSLDAIVARQRWITERYPIRFGDDLPAWLAVRDGLIVGHVGALPIEVVFHGLVRRMWWARELIVDPRARGSGLGALLIMTLAEHARGLLLGGLNDRVRAMYGSLGFVDRGAVPFFVLPLDAGVLLAAGGLARWRALSPVLTLAVATLSAGRRAPREIEVRGIDRFDEGFDRWWSSVERTLGCVARRSSALMNWRYAEHPSQTYRCFAAFESDAPRGYLVVRWGSSRGAPAGFLVEVLARPDDTRVTDALIAAGVRLLRERDSAFIRVTTNGTMLRSRLMRAGFLPAPSPVRWMIDSRDPVIAALPASRWFLNAGDSDLDTL